MKILGRKLAIVVLLVAGGAPLARTAAVPEVWWGRADTTDLALIQAHQSALDALLDDYNFGYDRWELHRLQVNWMRHYRIYEAIAFNPYRQITEFVLIAPLPGEPDQQLSLIPIWYEGTAFDDISLDRHNIAIFNRVVTGEQSPPAADEDWIRLALLYLNLVGQQPQPVTAGNREAICAGRLNRKEWPDVPEVVKDADGTVEVKLANFNADSTLVSWDFRFDAGGQLRGIQAHALTKPPKTSLR